jgi:prevent-host-death family protein
MTEKVGVRELRQNLSKYLERVKDGESLAVTERGREVARLVPSRESLSEYQRTLVEKYGATLAEGDLIEAIRTMPPPDEPAPDGTTDAILAEGRDWRF